MAGELVTAVFLLRLSEQSVSLPVRLFRTPSTEYKSSIAIDACTIEGTTVTVAVHATRDEEVAILDCLLRHSDAIQSQKVLGSGSDKTVIGGFSPFATKARDLDHEEDSTFFESVILENKQHISGFQHSHRGNANSEDVEAVHSSILVEDAREHTKENPLVLVDGGRDKGKRLVKSLSGLTDEFPAIVNCLQAEYYYPHALLADLTANYLAWLINEGEFDYMDPLVRAFPAKHYRGEAWGKAFSSLKNSTEEYNMEPIRQRRADSKPERVRCWYDGAVTAGNGSEDVATDSLHSICQYLKRIGYEELATELESM